MVLHTENTMHGKPVVLVAQKTGGCCEPEDETHGSARKCLTKSQYGFRPLKRFEVVAVLT